MALYSLTKRQLRAMLLQEMEAENGVIVNETASSTAVGSVTFSQLAGMYEDNHFKGGTVRVTLTSGATVVTRRVLSSTGSSGVITPVTNFHGSTAPDTTNIEVVRANTAISRFDSAVERAMQAVVKKVMVDKTNGYVMLERGRWSFDVPDGYVAIDDDGIDLDWSAFGGDRCYTSINNSGRTEYATGAATTNIRRAQGYQVTVPGYISTVWLPLRKVGTGSALTVSLQTDSSSAPSGTNIETVATASLAASSVSTTGRWVRVALDGPVWHAASTQYWLVVTDSAADSSNYTLWMGDTTAGYGYGSGSVYDSGGASWSAASTDYLFRLQRPDDECDWRTLHRDNWKLVNDSTRRLTIKPNNAPADPVPIRISGQAEQADISGTTNDGTTITGDPEVILKLAGAYYLEALATQRNDPNLARMAALRYQQADVLLQRAGTPLRGRRVERN